MKKNLSKRYRKKRYVKRTGKPSAALTKKVKRIINRTGEAKVSTIFEDKEVFIWSDNTDEIQGYNIFENKPEVGPSREQRIGNKIFIKDVTMEFAYGYTPNGANTIIGNITLFILKEKRFGGHRNVADFIIQGMGGSINSVEPRTLQTTYSYIKRHDFYVGPAWGQLVHVDPNFDSLTTAAVHKPTLRFKKTVKVNKTVTFDENADINVPGIYFVWVRWSNQYTVNVGEPEVSLKSIIRYTDA